MHSDYVLTDQYFKRSDTLGTYRQRLDVLQEAWENIDTQIQVSSLLDSHRNIIQTVYEIYYF